MISKRLENSKLRLFCNRLNREIDVLYVFLVLLSDTEFFPEMYEIFGKRVLDFLEVFGGQTIRVPTRELMEEVMEKVSIWCDFEEGMGMEELSIKYGKSGRELSKILEEVRVKLESFGAYVISTGKE